MWSCPACTQNGSGGESWQRVFDNKLVDASRRPGSSNYYKCHAMYDKGGEFMGHLREKRKCIYHIITLNYLEMFYEFGTKLWLRFFKAVNFKEIVTILGNYGEC